MVYQLVDVKGIGTEMAKKIEEAGIKTVEELASSKLEDVVKLKIKGIGKATALKLIESARLLVEEKSAKETTEIKEKPDKKTQISKQKKPTKSTNLKELIKKQAECNIGLVGHVDHGMN